MKICPLKCFLGKNEQNETGKLGRKGGIHSLPPFSSLSVGFVLSPPRYEAH